MVTFKIENITFKSLLDRYRIEIPRIQRDYAQGRTNKLVNYIRSQFIENIIYTLNKEGANINLNFIFGAVRSNKTFIPIDGQQRLTTLFLFHLYLNGIISIQKDRKDKFCSFNILDEKEKSRFTYKTRDSSERFINYLVKNREAIFQEIENRRLLLIRNNDLNKKKQLTEEEKKELDEINKIPKLPSQIISNQSWFFSYWKLDPTITGILEMIDEIHNSFVKYDSIWLEKIYERLLTSDAVTFKFLNLEDYPLTDDLYIKMNSRGINLTNFEIFKSKIIECFDNLFSKNEKNNSSKIETYLDINKNFKNSIDGIWLDFLWKKKDDIKSNKENFDKDYKGGMPQLIDEVYEYTFRFLLPIIYVSHDNPETEDIDNTKINNLFNDEIIFSFNNYLEGKIFTKELLKELYQYLEILFSKNTSPLEDTNITRNNDLYNIYDISIREIIDKLIVGENITYRDRLILYSWLLSNNELLLKGDKNNSEIDFQNEIKYWNKLVFRFIENSRIDSIETLINAFKGIKKIFNSYINSNKPLYVWLKDSNINDLKHTPLSTYQIQEEIFKARLRTLNVDGSNPWYNKIATIEEETIDILKGQIGYLLEIVGLIKCGDSPKIWVFQEEDLKKNGAAIYEEFNKYSLVFIPLLKVLNKTDASSSEENSSDFYKFIQALLKKGVYLISLDKRRWNLANQKGSRDFWWNNLLSLDKEDYKNQRRVFTEVLDILSKDIQKDKTENYIKIDQIEAYLKEINPNPDIPLWRKILSGEFGIPILKESKKGFIYFPEYDWWGVDKDKRKDWTSDTLNKALEVRIISQSQLNSKQSELYSYYLYLKLKQAYINRIEFKEASNSGEKSYLYLPEKSISYYYGYYNDTEEKRIIKQNDSQEILQSWIINDRTDIEDLEIVKNEVQKELEDVPISRKNN